MTDRAYTAQWGVVHVDGRTQLVPDPVIHVDRHGTVTGFGAADDPDPPSTRLRYDLGPTLLLPGFVNAHSHAFQRSIRGTAGRRGKDDPSDFWSWRDAMYEAANGLDPDTMFEATRACFAEMLGAGITCVGEFHYLHHGPDGTPYEDPNELSSTVIRAAREVGIRLCLLDVFYERAGAGRSPLAEQRRFCDADVDAYLARIDALRSSAAGNDALHSAGFSLGITPHSVRAVSADSLQRLSDYAKQHGLVMHAHVSEQPRENDECTAEYSKTPLQVFADAGCCDRPRTFTAVHAVHVTPQDVTILADQHVCACPTTEADLGDGIVPASRHLAAGVRLCLGSDSNSVIDLVQEARLLEMNERLRTHSRLCLRDSDGKVATTLLDAATTGGASSLGLASHAGSPGLGRLEVGSPFDAVGVDLTHPSLERVPGPNVLDALMLSGTAAPIRSVWIGGEQRI